MCVTRFSIKAALAAFILLVFPLTTTAARAGAPFVVVSIKPLHAIVAAVMAGVTPPRLLIKGSASPHDYAMRPSDAAALDDADLIVWIGEAFELFLVKPLEALAGDAVVIALTGTKGEPHIWLDPANAREIAEQAAAALSRLDPANRALYRANTVNFSARLDRLDKELRATLAPIADRPYLVFHDAYRAFERRYGLAGVGAITVNHQHKPGARRIADLRENIRVTGVQCLFAEPGPIPTLLKTLIEDSTVRTGVLDPLGAALAPGPEAYFTLMRNLAENLRDCLAVG